MNHSTISSRLHAYPLIAASVAIFFYLAAATIIVLFGWNSFAVPVLELDRIGFREALGLTLLLAVAGRLISPRLGARHQPHYRNSERTV